MDYRTIYNFSANLFCYVIMSSLVTTPVVVITYQPSAHSNYIIWHKIIMAKFSKFLISVSISGGLPQHQFVIIATNTPTIIAVTTIGTTMPEVIPKQIQYLDTQLQVRALT